MPKAANNNIHCEPHTHPDHSDELSRLNRIAGQVEGIKKMIEEKRYCPDIMIQLRAIQSATKSIESNILQRHLEACVRDTFSSSSAGQEQEEKISELMRLFKKQ